MHHYTQCLQQPPELAEVEEEEVEVALHQEEVPPQHPTWEAFKASHPPSSVATTPEATPSYANSSTTND